MKALRLEILKLKRSRFWSIAAGSASIVLLWFALLTLHRAHGPEESRLAVFAVNEAVNLSGILIPIVAALLASRIITIDTEQGMGDTLTAFGQPARRRWLTKLQLVLGCVVLIEGLMLGVAETGRAWGLVTSPAHDSALLPTALVLFAGTIATVSAQLALATIFDKQGIGLACAVIGGIAASSLPFLGAEYLGWLLPWGLLVAANPVAPLPQQIAGADALLISYPILYACGALAAAVLWLGIASVLVTRKETAQ